MGAGNFFFSRNVCDSEEVYVEYAAFDEEHYNDGTEFEWSDMIDNIQSILPQSFCSCKPTFWAGEGVIIAYNNLVKIVIRDNDGFDATLGIVVEDGSDFENLAKRHLANYANVIFDQLSEMYELRVRACAWTSGAYISKKAA
ncbi:MAG: hypothetical protein HUJ13_11165 [Hydrogenovibrio crunogenus]|nr:hypothetical protein [Hydrogenovibrio crunogenus]